jgi:hypothetical protein
VYDPYSSRGEHDRTILTQFGSALATFQLPDVDVPRLQGRTQGSVRSRCAKPEQWPGSEDNVPNSEVSASRHFLSEDFCVLDGEHYFVRCILEIPIIGSAGQRFAYGVWSTLSEKNFRIYAETFDSGEQGELGPWFGWFSNRLKGYPDTLNLKNHVHPQHGRQRPWIELEPTDHPLAVEQRNGITLERLLEIYALNGHDIRRALVD